MTLPADLALLETGALACAGAFLGLAWARARRGGANSPGAPAGRTFLLFWIPPAFARLATLLPAADPRISPDLALPLAAPASAALALLLVLAPAAYLAVRNAAAARRRGLALTALVVAVAIVAGGLAASPFDAARLDGAVADHGRSCEALARAERDLPSDEAGRLVTMAGRERAEAAAEVGRVHSRRGLRPALARLEERRRAFEERLGRYAASLEAQALARRAALYDPSDPAPSPAPPPRAAASRAGCAAVDPGMAAREVERLLGLPDQRISAEDVRGPGAERWAYARLLCRIHLVDGVVEFVD